MSTWRTCGPPTSGRARRSSDEFDLVVDLQIELEREALRQIPKRLLTCDTDVLETALQHDRYVDSVADESSS